MAIHGVHGRQPAESLAVVAYDLEVAHHGDHAVQRERITTIHVGPQGSTHKQHTVDRDRITFEKMHVGKPCALVAQVLDVLDPFAMIEFVVAGHVDHVRESPAAPLQEITETHGLTLSRTQGSHDLGLHERG